MTWRREGDRKKIRQEEYQSVTQGKKRKKNGEKLGEKRESRMRDFGKEFSMAMTYIQLKREQEITLKTKIKATECQTKPSCLNKKCPFKDHPTNRHL